MGRETINYNGKNYHRHPESERAQHRNYFWRHDKWKESPVALHRQIYEDVYGSIPPKHHIHHKDGDFSNNSIENLECIAAGEHRKRHPASEEARIRMAERSKERDPLGEWRRNNPNLAKEHAIQNGKQSQGLSEWRKNNPELVSEMGRKSSQNLRKWREENPELAKQIYTENGKRNAEARKEKRNSLQHNGG